MAEHWSRKFNDGCQGLGEWQKEKLFSVYRVSNMSNEKVLYICFKTVRIHLILLNCTCEIVKIVISMSCIFYHNKEKGGGVGKITKIE